MVPPALFNLPVYFKGKRIFFGGEQDFFYLSEHLLQFSHWRFGAGLCCHPTLPALHTQNLAQKSWAACVGHQSTSIKALQRFNARDPAVRAACNTCRGLGLFPAAQTFPSLVWAGLTEEPLPKRLKPLCSGCVPPSTLQLTASTTCYIPHCKIFPAKPPRAEKLSSSLQNSCLNVGVSPFLLENSNFRRLLESRTLLAESLLSVFPADWLAPSQGLLWSAQVSWCLSKA